MQRHPSIPFFLILVISSFALPQDEPRYKAEVDAALYEVRVRDETGESISGLELEDSIVLEEGKPRPIVFFSEQTDEPVTVAMLLDHGSAMSQESILTGKELIFDLIHLLDPQDLILVATFGEEVDVVSDLTSDRHALLEGIENIYSGARPTRWSWASPALTGAEKAVTLGIRFSPSNSNTGDAVDAALRQIARSSNPSKVILVISAGFPNLGEPTLDRLRSAGVRFFGVAVDYKLGHLLGFGLDRMGQRVVDETGGILYSANRVLEQVEQLRDAMKNFYLLAYQPAEPHEFQDRKVEFCISSGPEYKTSAVHRDNTG